MAEAASLVLGTLGLAGLFSACVQAFDAVQLGQNQGRSLEILMTKLDNQKARFIIWGEALDLDHHQFMHDARLDDPRRQESLKRSCRFIYKLFTENRTSETRYGLKKDSSGPASNALRLDDNSSSAWKITFQRIRARMASKDPPRGTYGNVVRWIVKDQEDFLLLVKDLRELIDDLESLTAFRDIRKRQRYITTYEIESIPDDGSIQLVEESSAGEEGLISAAVSVRSSRRARSLPTSGATQSFHTAYEYHDTTENSLPSLDEGSEDEMSEDFRVLQEAVDALTDIIKYPALSAAAQEAEGLKFDQAMKAIKDPLPTKRQIRKPQHMRVMDNPGPGSSSSHFAPFGTPSPDAVHARQILEKIHFDNVQTCRNWEPDVQSTSRPIWLRRCCKELIEVARTDHLDAHDFVTLAPIPCAENNRFRGTILGPQLTPYEAGVAYSTWPYCVP